MLQWVLVEIKGTKQAPWEREWVGAVSKYSRGVRVQVNYIRDALRLSEEDEGETWRDAGGHNGFWRLNEWVPSERISIRASISFSLTIKYKPIGHTHTNSENICFSSFILSKGHYTHLLMNTLTHSTSCHAASLKCDLCRLWHHLKTQVLVRTNTSGSPAEYQPMQAVWAFKVMDARSGYFICCPRRRSDQRREDGVENMAFS